MAVKITHPTGTFETDKVKKTPKKDLKNIHQASANKQLKSILERRSNLPVSLVEKLKKQTTGGSVKRVLREYLYENPDK